MSPGHEVEGVVVAAAHEEHGLPLGDAQPGLLRRLAEPGAVLGNEVHLCAAAGMPVVGLFGPTTSRDGFWVHRGEAVELDLSCRPCSRFGGPRCPVGDHACLREIDAARVLAAARSLA